ncbi:LysE family translocator [Shewanella sp. GXUN23E]|uniref:LysE family translocator n=1 Tax=Shewanella sp. GXUN23E TaxID=3422498 RepID=UPI003D7D52AD
METQLFITLAGIHWLALMSPGPDFALMLNKATAQRSAALATALGISVAILIHTLASLSGISLLIQSSPPLFTLVKILGASYLGWMGLQMLRSGWRRARTCDTQLPATELPTGNSFMQGLYTNLLNPKALVFFLTLFSTLVSADAGFMDKLLICILMFSLSLLWFSLLAVGLTSRGLRPWLQAKTCFINNLSGLLFVVVAITILANLLVAY